MENFNVTGQQLVVGECYMYKGKNMGKFIKFELTGRPYDPDERYTFENGVIDDGRFHQREREFTLVQCSGGGARRKRVTRKRVSTLRKSRRTRKNRATRRYKKHKR